VLGASSFGSWLLYLTGGEGYDRVSTLRMSELIRRRRRQPLLYKATASRGITSQFLRGSWLFYLTSPRPEITLARAALGRVAKIVDRVKPFSPRARLSSRRGGFLFPAYFSCTIESLSTSQSRVFFAVVASQNSQTGSEHHLPSPLPIALKSKPR